MNACSLKHKPFSQKNGKREPSLKFWNRRMFSLLRRRQKLFAWLATWGYRMFDFRFFLSVVTKILLKILCYKTGKHGYFHCVKILQRPLPILTALPSTKRFWQLAIARLCPLRNGKMEDWCSRLTSITSPITQQQARASKKVFRSLNVGLGHLDSQRNTEQVTGLWSKTSSFWICTHGA